MWAPHKITPLLGARERLRAMRPPRLGWTFLGQARNMCGEGMSGFWGRCLGNDCCWRGRKRAWLFLQSQGRATLDILHTISMRYAVRGGCTSSSRVPRMLPSQAGSAVTTYPGQAHVLQLQALVLAPRPHVARRKCRAAGSLNAHFSLA